MYRGMTSDIAASEHPYPPVSGDFCFQFFEINKNRKFQITANKIIFFYLNIDWKNEQFIYRENF